MVLAMKTTKQIYINSTEYNISTWSRAYHVSHIAAVCSNVCATCPANSVAASRAYWSDFWGKPGGPLGGLKDSKTGGNK